METCLPGHYGWRLGANSGHSPTTWLNGSKRAKAARRPFVCAYGLSAQSHSSKGRPLPPAFVLCCMPPEGAPCGERRRSRRSWSETSSATTGSPMPTRRFSAAQLASDESHTTAPNRATAPAVTPIASAPQKVTRIAPGAILAPPVRAATAPRHASTRSDAAGTAKRELASGTARSRPAAWPPQT